LKVAFRGSALSRVGNGGESAVGRATPANKFLTSAFSGIVVRDGVGDTDTEEEALGETGDGVGDFEKLGELDVDGDAESGT
jgi:hypothetical protein